MADWLVEEGIGEHRAIRLVQDSIVAARVAWPGELDEGAVVDAVLIARRGQRGTARTAAGDEILVDRLPADAHEGGVLRIAVTRAAIGEPGRLKRAHGRPSAEPCMSPTLAERLAGAGEEVRIVRRFPVPGWSDLVADAFAAHFAFDGGALDLTPAAAMTLIDVDGALAPRALALAAVPAIGPVLQRLAISGSVGIDFPTLPQKDDRRAVDAALAEVLRDWPHERTAMNGFGFVQVVARLTGPSILQRARWRPAATAARLLLRRVEAVAEPGAVALVAHPRVHAAILPGWRDELARRTGREIRLQPDEGLAPEAGFAQAVPR